MFAFFNFGVQEIAILFVICLYYGVPILIVGAVLFLVLRKGRKSDPGAVMELRSEVERLREDVDRLKRELVE